MTTTSTELRDVEPGTVVLHPAYGRVTVEGRVDRGDLTNTAGFASGVWIILDDEARLPVYAYTRVEVVEEADSPSDLTLARHLRTDVPNWVDDPVRWDHWTRRLVAALEAGDLQRAQEASYELGTGHMFSWDYDEQGRPL